MEHQPPSLNIDDLIPVQTFLERYPYLWGSRQSFNWAHHQRHKNGMAEFGVTTKIGRKVLVSKRNLERWLASGKGVDCGSRKR